jgi:MFS family permease
VAWWSVFTALTAACTGFASLVVVRVMFGAGEAGAYPNAARVIRRWFPIGERGRVQGLVMAAALAGGAVAPPSTAYLIEAFGWRTAFVAYGALGLVWAIAFAVWFRDGPDHHPTVNAGERELLAADGAASEGPIGPTPWRAALRHGTLWLLGGVTTCVAFTSYFYYSWFPKYLQVARGMSPEESGWLTSAALSASAAGLLTGGFIADWAARHGDVMRRRRWLGTSVLIAAAGLLAAVPALDSPSLAVLAASASCFLMTCQNASWWACASEVSGRHIGALFGLMNSLGVAGAASSQLFFGAFADWRAGGGYTGRDQWDPAFSVPVALLLLAAALWQRMSLFRPVADPGGTATRPIKPEVDQ